MTKERTWKYMAGHGILALVIAGILSAMFSSLGSLSFDIATLAAVIGGSGLAAVVVAHIKGNILLIAFISGATATGAAFFIANLMSLTTIGPAMTLIFVGNAVAGLVVRHFHKG